MFPSRVEPVPHDQVTSDRPGGWGTLGDCAVLVVGTRPRLWKTPLSCLARQHRKWINQRGEIKSGGEGGGGLSDICIFKLGIELWRNVVIIHPQPLQWWRILHWNYSMIWLYTSSPLYPYSFCFADLFTIKFLLFLFFLSCSTYMENNWIYTKFVRENLAEAGIKLLTHTL